ncbi:protein pelota homolog [Octopus bimaculoides]|uniref:Protein pelota homolog n=1 Tax=Octopus bimaculoides TaxID=37653 RepID=A0A0L8HTG7_OCTBM|nr:protein pelota homolog [Octopus bimaculoides]|eukprot:XP_014769545.1 PREDICTED: protein pelota homolog [Octopus bimaculoides]
MRRVYQNIDKYNDGCMVLIPEEAEDMWHAYNLVAVGDVLKSTTIRKVQNESATGSVSASKVRTVLTIRVEAIDFDTQACVLRVKGRNIAENQYVKMGAYHTLDLELNRKFTLEKHWDSITLERIDTACDPAQNADLAAIVMQEGLGHLCLVTSSMTLVKAKIETNIPRKRKGMCAQHDKGLMKFYDQMIQAVRRHVNFEIVKCLLIASPGFVKDQFFSYMLDQAVKNDWKDILENKSRCVLAHSSSGFKHSLKEVLQDPSMANRLADTKALGEVKALDEFYNMLVNDPDRAVYGIKPVEKASDLLAIETLMVSDELFRSRDIQKRQRYVALVDKVKENGADVKIFSSLHVSGEQLGQLTGVAALLRYPIPEEDEVDGVSDSED